MQLSLVVFLAVAPSLGLSAYTGSGTTRNLEDIFMGRCYDYTSVRNSDGYEGVDCAQLWQSFSDAFKDKDACSLTLESYDPFLNSLPPMDLHDQALFWSGVYKLIVDYTNDGQRQVAVSDTLMGYLADSLYWCGKEEAPGFDYDSCPKRDECGDNGGEHYEAFWGSVSKKFAEESSGVVRVFVNGSRGSRDAFEEGSYFAVYELPNFNSSKVTRMIVNVIQSLDDGVPRETCDTGSVPKMLQLIRDRDIETICIETPAHLRHYLCIDEWRDDDCIFAVAAASSPASSLLPVLVLALSAAILLA